MEIKWSMKKDMYRQAGTERVMKINFLRVLEMRSACTILDQCPLGEANELSHT